MLDLTNKALFWASTARCFRKLTFINMVNSQKVPSVFLCEKP